MLQFRNLLGWANAPREASRKHREGGASDVAASSQAAAIAEGKALFSQGRLADALAVTDEALVHVPESGVLHFARGATLFAWERHHEARESYERARAAGLDDLDLDIHLGWVYLNLGRIDDAVPCFESAVTKDPESAQAYVALANALESRGALSFRAAEFAQGLARWTRNYEGLLLRSACQFYLGDREGGTATVRAAVELDPTRSRAWANLGVTLCDDGRFAEAIEALCRAHVIDVANGAAESLFNYATVLREDGRIEESLRIIEEQLATHPDPRVHWMRSMLLLELGRYPEAWPQHEFRWMKEPLVDQRRPFFGPVWSGQDLKGKTILLHAEQGLGDAIQFVRFARPLKERGARVILDSFRDLGGLSQDFCDIDEVASDGCLPAFDFRIPLLSIPRVLGTTIESIPAHVPYVDVRPEYREHWAKRVEPDERLRIGIVWSGNLKHPRNKYRSVALTRLAPLWSLDGIRIYSLQKSATAEVEIATSGFDIVDLGKDFESFRDTAAAISLLDLVISVDTSVAHLAGALGAPTWVLVGEPPDWRWLVDGNTTPWYPSARIFRQTRRDLWDPVIAELVAALRERVDAHRNGFSDRAATPRASSNGRLMSQPTITREVEEQFSRVDETRNGIIQSLPSTEYAAAFSYYGEHRQTELELIGRFVRPGAWIVEEGCGIGAATLFLARTVSASGHVIAYEPDRLKRQIAKQNLYANRFRNVTLLPRSLGAASVEATVPGADAQARPAVDTIDGLRLAELDWVRINTGTLAAAVLSGGSDTLWRLRPWVFITTENDTQEKEALAVLRDHAYQCRHFRAPLFRTDNYNRRTDDIFGGRVASGLLCVPEEVEIDTELEGCTAIL
jgi:tetratricopeptide (TPR) repeat protein